MVIRKSIKNEKMTLLTTSLYVFYQMELQSGVLYCAFDIFVYRGDHQCPDGFLQ